MQCGQKKHGPCREGHQIRSQAQGDSASHWEKNYPNLSSVYLKLHSASALVDALKKWPNYASNYHFSTSIISWFLSLGIIIERLIFDLSFSIFNRDLDILIVFKCLFANANHFLMTDHFARGLTRNVIYKKHGKN